MADVKRRDLLMVPFSKLKIIDGFNIRTYDMDYIRELSDSIRDEGVKIPFQGWKEKDQEVYNVKDGHHRYKAIELLIAEGVEEIEVPFVLERKGYSAEQRVIDMFTMNSGRPLTPLDQAEGVRRLQNYGYSDSDIARKIGRSGAYVGKLALLTTAPKKMVNLIQKGTIAASFAMEIIAKGEVDKFLEDVESGVFQVPLSTPELYSDKPEKPVKITKASLPTVNSWKGFKTFAKSADHKLMEDDKAKFFKFLCKVMNNEVDEDQIKRFFK